jgi:hypothetical protein
MIFMGKIETFDQFFDEVEKQIWDTEQIFRPVEDWHEDDGDALFFKLDAGESPKVTSPITSNWDDNYFTHWMPLPKELSKTADYRLACIKSGIETKYR